MAQVLVRSLDDGVVARLKTKAELKGRSLEQELREILTRESGLTPAEKVATADRIRAQTIGPYTTNAVEEIRRLRDER